jgi:flagellar biosynthesis protein FlhG
VNFSLELINQGKKVLLIDLDIGMGNIDVLFGLHTDCTITDMLENCLPASDVIRQGPGSLAYIAGGVGLADFFRMDQMKFDHFLIQYDILTKNYDFIIFDMGAGATNDSMSFILASDICFVVTTPEPTALTDAYGMIKHIIFQQGRMPICVLMNRAQSEKSAMRTLTKFRQIINRFLHIEVCFLGILPEDRTVQSAVIKQTPYVLLNEKADISQAMKQLVSNYLSGSAESKESRSISFIEKLKKMIAVR